MSGDGMHFEFRHVHEIEGFDDLVGADSQFVCRLERRIERVDLFCLHCDKAIGAANVSLKEAAIKQHKARCLWFLAHPYGYGPLDFLP